MNKTFPPEVREAIANMDKEKIRAVEFEAGLTLQWVGVEKVKSQYGASEDARIVERGILEEGEQFLYTFKDQSGMVRKHYSTSFPLCTALNKVELNEGDWVQIQRSGKGTDTRYAAEKMEALRDEDYNERPSGSVEL